VWNVRLSEIGGQIVKRRRQFIDTHTVALNKLYNTLVETEHTIVLAYSSKITTEDYTSSMLHALERDLDKDSLRGFTSTGPHRDDLAISIDGHELALTASRGETRTIMLALKLLELESLEQARGIKPILLLDDVFSELDGARRRKLTDYLQTHQSFITTTDADIVVQHFLGNCRVIAMG
jgi:DNA replication and repair protein RecF